ncbi:MAG: sulfotransferase [Deltaproteobacteria bacterium]|nr:sulfotransferase [Deltaproteobacteria bacterium]
MPNQRLRRLMLQSVQGMTLGTLGRVLLRHRLAVAGRYWDRLLYLFLLGLLNSLARVFEQRCNHYKLAGVEPVAPPVFILGHWRSGTTHLQNLLSLDEQFYAPSAFQMTFPHHFLYSTPWGARHFDRFAPKKRPMDDMSFFARAPHEDEFGLAGLTAVSPYLTFLFPATGDAGLCALDPLRLPPEALQAWKSAFLYLLKKLTFHKNKRLLLKSPPHTGRVRVLLELCPGAKFVHIVRNPYEVYLSTRKLWLTSLSHSHLQVPESARLEGLILSWYQELYRLFERDRGLIPPGDLSELTYEDLVREPRRCLEKVYDELGLPGFERFWPRVSEYLETLRDYRRDTYRLDRRTRETVVRHWGWAFDRFGYPR